MARYRVKAPDGSTLEFEGPDNASDQQVMEYAQQNWGAKPKPEQEAIGPEDPGIGGAMLIGAGRTADKVVQGAKQLYLGAASKLTGNPEYDQRLQALAEQEAGNDKAYAGLQQVRPFSSGVGQAIPYLAIPASAGALGMAGIVGGTEAAQYGTIEERALRGAVGAGASLVGSGIAAGVRKAIAPTAGNVISDTQKSALNAMRANGYQPRLSEMTGSPLAARMEDFAARTPGGAGRMQGFAEANQAVVNRVASRAIGENADELTPAVFDAASKRLGKVFEDIKGLGSVNVNGRQLLPIKIDRGVYGAADDILRAQGKLPDQFRDTALMSIATDAKKLAGMSGRIDGEAYQLTRSELTRAAYDAFKAGNGNIGQAYKKLLGALDDSAETSLRAVGKGDLAQALRAARPEWGNLMTLEKGLVAEGGNVSPARLAQALRSSNPKGFREGASGDLFDLARFGEAFKPLRQGSQTYERELVSNPFRALLTAGPANVAARITTSPVATWYPANVGNTAAADTIGRLLGQGLRPAVMAPTMNVGANLFGQPVTAK